MVTAKKLFFGQIPNLNPEAYCNVFRVLSRALEDLDTDLY